MTAADFSGRSPHPSGDGAPQAEVCVLPAARSAIKRARAAAHSVIVFCRQNRVCIPMSQYLIVLRCYAAFLSIGAPRQTLQ